MNLLLTSSLPSLERMREDTGSTSIGRLLTPRCWSRIEDTANMGEWAADNDAFSGFDDLRFVKMLDAIAAAGAKGCRFVTAPDVVGEAEPTLERFVEWRPSIVNRGLPAGLVLQDGMTVDTVPWDLVDAVFVGGSTEWKLGDEAREIVRVARLRGLWTHVGRVNSLKRLRIAADMGADSVDGSGWVRFKRNMLPRWTAFETERAAAERSAA